ncbi:phage tail tube protein [uncultured Jatrophihabitans sp.]|uniref:phage tail tube protein n=1 Tax=uncultured Jatrophihabitans sp. TaxID=1610747 RepID=UPI0035CBAC2E
MTAPVLLDAGDATPARLLTCDILTSGTLQSNPVWSTLQYVNELNLVLDDPSWQTSTVYGSGGYGSQDKLGTQWSATLTVEHQITPNSNPPAYDPTHDYLEALGQGAFGRACTTYFRFYDFDVNDLTGVVTPRPQAYLGRGAVSWPGYGGGDQDNPRTVAVAVQGKGKLTRVAHPYPAPGATPVVPTVAQVVPSTLAVAGGKAVELIGSAFTGTTGVTFGGTAATNVQVINDGKILATAPAHATGTGLAVVVTNATGPSTGGPTVAFA